MSDFVGQYQLIKKIAEGGMAEIFLAKSTKFKGVEKYVVIKRILPEYSGSSELIKMFINEARVNMHLNHSNIACIYDFGIESGNFFIAMEYVQGINLQILTKTLEHKSLPKLTVAESLYIILHAASGLGYAHNCKGISQNDELNIIHRDVSPDNIMVSLDGGVKVIDFGIAINGLTQEETRKNTAGKYAYMSPEQVKKEKLSVQTDIFSLGLVLWELLTGEKKYRGTVKADIITQALNPVYKSVRALNSEVSERLDEIVKKALHEDMVLRYQTMQEFYIDLNKYLNTNYPEFLLDELKEKIAGCYEQEKESLQKTLVTTVFKENKPLDSRSADFEKTILNIENKERRKPKGRITTRRRKKVKKAS